MAEKLYERCLHQVCPQKIHYIDGKILNNCAICSYDPNNNKNCPKYFGLKMKIFEVKEYEKD